MPSQLLDENPSGCLSSDGPDRRHKSAVRLGPRLLSRAKTVSARQAVKGFGDEICNMIRPIGPNLKWSKLSKWTVWVRLRWCRPTSIGMPVTQIIQPLRITIPSARKRANKGCWLQHIEISLHTTLNCHDMVKNGIGGSSFGSNSLLKYSPTRRTIRRTFLPDAVQAVAAAEGEAIPWRRAIFPRLGFLPRAGCRRRSGHGRLKEKAAP